MHSIYGYFILFLFVISCGVKAPPLPPVSETPEEVIDQLDDIDTTKQGALKELSPRKKKKTNDSTP